MRHHVVSLNRKYQGSLLSLLYVPNIMSMGRIMLKVEGGGGQIDPPTHLSVRVTFFGIFGFTGIMERKI